VDHYADTSFLASLYLHDANTPSAFDWMRVRSRPLVFTALHRHELRNAVWQAAFQRRITVELANRALADIEQDIAVGRLDPFPLDWGDACREAERIGDAHTAHLGIRSLDLLHLGAARSMRAKTILSFDQRQLAVAKAVGFQTGP
jgi:hypothetical protein